MGLRRVLGLSTVVSTSAGLAFAAINFLALVQVATLASGSAAPVAILVAGALCLFAAANFSELNGMLPSAAGIRVWTRQGIGDRFSLVFTLMYLTTVLAVIAADSFILAQAITAGVPSIPGLFWVVLFLTLALAANLTGVKFAGRLQDATTYALLASLVVIAAVVLIRHPAVVVPAVFNGNFPEAISVGVFVFVGFEWVTPLAEEIRIPTTITRGMYLALGLIAVAFGSFSLAMEHVLPPSVLAHSTIPQLLVGRSALGDVGFWWMLVVTAVTAVTTFNGSMVSASRLLYALARERSLPSSLAALSSRLVPYRSLIVLWAISLVLAVLIFITRAWSLLINTGAALEALMYIVAALSVVGLRRRRPDLPRPFRSGPIVPWITAVLFAVLALGAMFTPTPGISLPLVPILLVAVGLAAFAYVQWGVPRLKRSPRATR